MRSRVVRSGAVALVVGATVGLLVAGGGARLAMRLIALADNREDFGATTGSEATVGEITLGGTVAVLLTGLAPSRRDDQPPAACHGGDPIEQLPDRCVD